MTPAAHPLRCEKCDYFKRWNNAGDAVGSCLSKKPYLTLLDVSYSVIALKGCASHSDSDRVLEEFLRELSKEEFHCMETPYAVIKRVHEIVEELRSQQQTKCEEVRRNLEQVKAKPSKEREP